MFLIVGLGNTGKKYENTYHNMGFWALDEFARKNDIKITKSKNNALIFEGKIGSKKVILVKPTTYMNNSGLAVRALMDKFKINSENVLVVYDDIDLPKGVVRFRNSGSAGTHNGMKSIISHINTQNFPRIRVGIDKDERIPLADYVLSKVNGASKKQLKAAIEESANLIEEFIKNDGKLENTSI